MPKTRIISISRIASALFLLGLVALAHAEPIVQTYTGSTADAPVLQLQDHGPIGRNVTPRWWQVGSHFLYVFCEPTNPDRGDPSATPMMYWVDLDSGKMTEIFAVTIGYRPAGQAAAAPKIKDAGDLLDTAHAPASRRTKAWEWARAAASQVAADGKLWITTDDNNVVTFDANTGNFEEVLKLPVPCNAIALGEKGVAWFAGADGSVHRYNDGFGIESFASVFAAGQSAAAMACDEQGVLYAAVRAPGGPVRLARIEVSKGKISAATFLAASPGRELMLKQERNQAWCEVTESNGEKSYLQLKNGKAEKTQSSPDLAKIRGFELTPDFDHERPSVWVKKPGQEKRQVSWTYSRATVDGIKCMIEGTDGKIYGACYPNAAIWEFDPKEGRPLRRGMHYVIYHFLPDGKGFYMIGYWGIKLMRWDVDQPWTFDYDLHYYKKKYPGNTSPWGSLDCNPQLICKFRYLRHLDIRRPAGLARGADGRIYTGARDIGINLEWETAGYKSNGTGIRYSGALCWFDPKEQTIGYETKDQDFEYFTNTDVCSVDNDRYIVAASKRSDNPFEPPPPANTPGGYIHIWDTQTHEFVARVSPTGGSVLYVQESTPGMLVGYTRSGGTSSLFVFDVKKKETVRIVKLPLRAGFSTYASPVRFERGPDQKIYFYGQDDQGVALFRFDSTTGTVEPVARGPGITDVEPGSQTLVFQPGNTLLFTKDRVYFGSSHLRSVALEKIIGPGSPSGGGK